MMDNEFTCPDGHTFTANAKLRARCAECGKLARRFNKKVESVKTVEPEVKPEPIVKPEPEVKTDPPEPKKRAIELVRRGRQKAMPKQAAKTSVKSKKAKPVKPVLRANKLVRNIRLKGDVKPVVRRMPKKMAVARHTQQKSYTDEIIERYGR